AWCPRRAHAPRTTTSAGCTAKPRSCWASAANAGAPPLVARDVEVGAYRPPHVPRVDAVFDGLGGGSSAESRQHVVDEHRRAAHRPELALDEFLEFRQPHPTQPTPTVRALHGTPVPDLRPRRCCRRLVWR